MIIPWEILSIVFAGWNDGNTFQAIDTNCQIALDEMKNEGLDFLKKKIVKIT